MSVVPFVLDNSERRTVVESREEYEQAGGLRGNVILIQNLDRDQILNTRSSNATYDLRVGNEYKGHKDAGKTDLLDGDKILLEPGSAVIIETLELVQFPKSRFGHIVPKVTLLQKGISNTSSKIDPGYNGHLLITVFNLGKKTISLKKEEKFCTLYTLELKQGEQVIAYEKVGKKLPGESRKNPWGKIVDFSERHSTFFNVLLTLVTVVATIITIISNTQNSVQQQQKPQLPSQKPSKSI